MCRHFRFPPLVLVLGLAACGSRAPAPAPASLPAQAQLPEQWYRQQQAAGAHILRIDPALSLIQVLVRRGGPLQALGHDHVVAAHDIAGYVAPDANRADFHFRLAALAVDETNLRRQAGLPAPPDAQAIAGTRHNMLTRVLDAERYPLVALHVERVPPAQARLTIDLHGVRRTLLVPAVVTAGASLRAEGTFTLNQTDFGIAPMSILGGALTVQDALTIRYTITAH